MTRMCIIFILFSFCLSCSTDETPTMMISIDECQSSICGEINLANIFRDGEYVDGFQNSVNLKFEHPTDTVSFEGSILFRKTDFSYSLEASQFASSGGIDFDLSLVQEYAISVSCSTRDLDGNDYDIPHEDIVVQ